MTKPYDWQKEELRRRLQGAIIERRPNVEFEIFDHDEHLEPIVCQTCGEELTSSNLCGCDEPLEDDDDGHSWTIPYLLALLALLVVLVYLLASVGVERSGSGSGVDRVYEDGSVVLENGRHFCIAGALCDS